jgi:hypothetical protein
MMLHKIFFTVLASLTVSQSMVAAQGKPLLWFNDTLLIPAPGPHKTIGDADDSCFPALGFKTPDTVPSSLEGWWCDSNTEYAFVGFSYEITQWELAPLPPLFVG